MQLFVKGIFNACLGWVFTAFTLFWSAVPVNREKPMKYCSSIKIWCFWLHTDNVMTLHSSYIAYLVGPTYEVHVMFVEELGHNIRPKGERDTTVILSPAHDIFIWVSPEQITQQTLVRDVCGPHHTSDLLHRLQVWRKTWG